MQGKFNLKREMIDKIEFNRVRNPNFEFHFHSHIELYIIKSGAVEIIVNDKKKVLRGGEISVALSYDSHGYRTLEESSAEYLIIPRSFCSDFLLLLGNKHAIYPFIDDAETFNTVLNTMDKLLEETNELKRRGYIYIILGAILDKLAMEVDGEALDTQFSADMLIYISKHFREELTLGTLAGAFGYNPSYLSRNFHQTFGISYGRYLNILRLREAVLLLSRGDMNITQCALESGFGSVRSFYRFFKDEFGCTPKEYFEAERKGL